MKTDKNKKCEKNKMSNLYSLPKEMLIKIICEMGEEDKKRIEDLEKKLKDTTDVLDKILKNGWIESEKCVVENCDSKLFWAENYYERAFFINCERMSTCECGNMILCSKHSKLDVTCPSCEGRVF